MNCRDIFVNVNLGLDEVFVCSYAIIFIPIWIWNVVSLTGFIVGIALWCRKCGEYRKDDSHRDHCGALVYTFVFMLILFLGEVMMVISADNPSLPWRAAFTPLYLLTGLSAGMIWWIIYKRRSCELELLSLMTCIQVILLGVRLDAVAEWTVAVTLVPTWLAVITATVMLIVYSLLVPILRKEKWLLPENRTNKIMFPFFAVSSLFIIILFTVFLVLLVVRLDRQIAIPYGAIFIPLHLTLFTLMANLLTRDWSGNTWWFGIRLRFGEFLLQKSALIQEFVNISYTKDDLLPPQQRDEGKHKSNTGKDSLSILGAIESLELPD